VTHPQSDVWVSWPEQFTDHIEDLLELRKGGVLFYPEDQQDAVKEALFNFGQNEDPKAVVDVSLTYSSGQVSSRYDGIAVDPNLR
jgi:hypothetical protein